MLRLSFNDASAAHGTRWADPSRITWIQSARYLAALRLGRSWHESFRQRSQSKGLPQLPRKSSPITPLSRTSGPRMALMRLVGALPVLLNRTAKTEY